MITLPAGYPMDGTEAFALLKTRPRLTLDDVKVLALIESAGEVFYTSMARGAAADEAKDLLLRNGQEERGHAHRLLKAIRLLGGENCTLPTHEDNPFAAAFAAERPLTDEFLESLCIGERDGDRQYQSWADAEPNSEVARLYRQNGTEEIRHGERLDEVRALLNGRP